MKFPRIAVSTLVLAGLAQVGVGGPVALRKRGGSTPVGPTETQTLQLALTLEHLENAFYQQGLKNYSASAFGSAGYPGWVRGRINEIAQHEKVHVSFLTALLGADAPDACNYSL